MESRFQNTPPEEQNDWRSRLNVPPPEPINRLQSESKTTSVPQTLCVRVREMLPLLLENDVEIRPEMATALYGHLAVCMLCAREFDEMQRLVLTLEALPMADMPLDFSVLIMQRIQFDTQAPKQKVQAPPVVPPVPMATAAETTSRNHPPRQSASLHTNQTTTTQNRQEQILTTGGFWQKLPMVGVLFASLLFLLMSGMGRRILSVNLATANAWFSDIVTAVQKIPVLGWIVGTALGALSQASSLIDETYRTLGETATRGFILDVALFAIAYHFLVRRHRVRQIGI